MPIHVPKAAGKPYRPSNGTEGMRFEEMFCDRCKLVEGCDILGKSMWHEIGDKGYPPELKFDSEGVPTCTKFVQWSVQSWRRNDDLTAPPE